MALVAKPRVVIAHDYLTQRGGAERVVLAMLAAFPDAAVVTSVYDPDNTFEEFKDVDVRTSSLSRIERFRRDPRQALPLLAPMWSRIRVEADVVLCSSSGWAHGVRTDGRKVVYCHNPARWLYQADEYLPGAGRAAKVALAALDKPLRRWDLNAARSADRYLANSSVVAARISDTYGIESTVVHPPSVVSGGELEPVPGIGPGFYLTVGRPRGYKNTAVVAQAVESLPDRRLVVVGGTPEGTWSDRVHGLPYVTDGQLRWLYANATALVACAYEDFGLTPIEAFHAGTPVLALHAGGYLDTMVPGLTGEFVATATAPAIADGLRQLEGRRYSADSIKQHSRKFGVDHFVTRLRSICGVYDPAETPIFTNR